MKNYEINSRTLAIVPVGENLTNVLEEDSEFMINMNSMKIIEKSCEFFVNSRIPSGKVLTKGAGDERRRLPFCLFLRGILTFLSLFIIIDLVRIGR